MRHRRHSCSQQKSIIFNKGTHIPPILVMCIQRHYTAFTGWNPWTVEIFSGQHPYVFIDKSRLVKAWAFYEPGQGREDRRCIIGLGETFNDHL